MVHLKLDDYVTGSRSMLMLRVYCSLYLYNVATTQLVRYIIMQLYASVFVTSIKFHMKKVLHIEVTRPKQNGFRAGQRHNVNMFNKSKQTFPTNYGPPTQLGYNYSEVPAVPPFLMYPWGPSFNPSLYTNTTKNSWHPQFT